MELVLRYLTAMKTRRFPAAAVAFAIAAVPLATLAQAPGSAPRIAAQKEAMAPLGDMDGVWRGPATTTLPSGEPMRFFEMKLRRVGDTDWPAGNPIPPK